MDVILLSHLGLGDNILNIPIVYYLLETYNNVYFVCFKHNLNNLKYIFNFDDKVKFLSFNSSEEIKNTFKNKSQKYLNGKLILRSGLHNINSNIASFPFFMYDDLNIDRNIMKTHFKVRNTNKSLELLELIKNNKYIFVSNETSRGELFNIDKLLTQYNIDKKEILIICSNANIYNSNDKFYNIANKFVYKSNDIELIDYKLVLENANFIILSDSSLFTFASFLNLNKGNKLVTRTDSVEWNNFLSFIENKFTLD